MALPNLLTLVFYVILTFFFRHKYTLFISADGNFKLQRKNKCGDPDDVSLNNGTGYFVEDKAYQKYLGHVGDCKDVRLC